MLKILSVTSSAIIVRAGLKYIWKPKLEAFQNSIQPPYDNLCVSAVLSRLAYKKPHNFKKESIEIVKNDPRLFSMVDNILPQNKNDYKFIDASKISECQDTQLYCWISDHILYVVFRGTESKDDWFANIDMRRKCIGFGDQVLVHNGFRKQFEVIEDELTDFITTNRNNVKEIIFIGHSLGVALACISALYYTEYFKENVTDHLPIIKCHGFGGPRVGNKEFTQFYADQKHLINNTWNVINYEDIVPKIPLSYRFQHVPCNTICISDDHKVEITQKDKHWIIRPIDTIVTFNFFKHIKPHDINLYIKKLQYLSKSIDFKSKPLK